MFQFRRFPSLHYLIHVMMHGLFPCGFPHSDICGSTLICSSPQLFAAYRVLHRLPVPRHSPCALSNLTKLALFSSLNYMATSRKLFSVHFCTLPFTEKPSIISNLVCFPICCLFVFSLFSFQCAVAETASCKALSKLNNTRVHPESRLTNRISAQPSGCSAFSLERR